MIATAVAALVLMSGLGAWSLFDAPRVPAAPAISGPELDPTLRTGKPTVVEFGANACLSCREMKVVLARLRQAYGDRVAVVEIDLLKQQEIAQRHYIQLMPTQVFFDAQGRETGRHMGKLGLEEVIVRLEQSASPRP
jgi:thioredoxin 1